MIITPLFNVNFQGWFQSLNWRQPSWDLFIVLIFFVGVFLYGFSLGRNKIIVVLICVYLTKAITDVLPILPKFEALNLGQSYVAQIVFFCLLFLILFLLFISSGPLRSLANMESGRWYHILIFSFLHVGLFVTIIFSYLPQNVIANFSSSFQVFFNSSIARFVWITLPIITLALIKDKKKKSSQSE